MAPQRLAFYIDGFNLYFGLKDSGWRKYYWLNLQDLCLKLTRPNQEIKKIRYFTARITGPDRAKQSRQKTYLEALETLDLVEIHYGHYLYDPVECFKCGRIIADYSEKMSDVNLAIYLLTDALDDLYDIAVLISADSDIEPGVKAVRKHAPNKKILLYFPPRRHSDSLRNACHSYGGTLFKNRFAKSQFPETVTVNTVMR